MRKINRENVGRPAVLALDQASKALTELTEARVYLTSKPKKTTAAKPAKGQSGLQPFKFRAYKEDSIRLALEKLFHGKCAYCECSYAHQAPVDIEHYRPKSRIAGEDQHPGYWWLAMEWKNLLPSCVDCNRRRWQELPMIPIGVSALLPKSSGSTVLTGKQDFFPISGKRAANESSSLSEELPDLLNPCEDSPSDHIEYFIDRDNPLGLVLPKQINGAPSRRGIVSIHVYGLNRLHLVQERTRLLRRLEFMAYLLEQLSDMIIDLKGQGVAGKSMAARLDILSEEILRQIRDLAADHQPFCSLTRAWISALKISR